MSVYESVFILDEIGETTGQKWPGEFKIKTQLSHRDFLLENQYYRDLIGANPGLPSPDAAAIATIISYLKIRILAAPEWWATYNGGLDLLDSNVLQAVYEKATQASDKAKDDLKKKAAQAKGDIQKELEKDALAQK